MWNQLFLGVFGVLLVSGLAYSNVIDASSIQEVNGQLVFSNISCYACEGLACAETNVSNLPVQVCNLFGAECVTTFNVNGTVNTRGCSNLISNTANATCISAPGTFCFTCVSPLCNIGMQKDEYVECYQCDSYSNSECVWNPNDTSVANVQCYASCIVALLPKSADDNSTYETYRGCESEVSALGITSCNATNDNCWSCSGEHCNSFNRPNNRLTCNFCTNTECNQTFSQDCISYRVDDKCAYVLNNDSTIDYLACASNFNPSTMQYMRGLGILVECDGVNCNTLANAPKPDMNSVSCMSCNSQNNEYCATNPSMINSTIECDDINKMCAMEITSDGHTWRGCMADLPKTDFLECYTGSNTTYCATCNGTSCNEGIFPDGRLACYQCNSDQDANCESNPLNATICPIYSANEMCTQYLVNTTTYRGCSSQFPCQGEKCTTCATIACNNQNLTDGSSTIQVTGSLLFISLIAILYKELGL